MGEVVPPIPPDQIRVEEAAHLIAIARDLRSLGDADLILMTEHGVGPANLTLAGELELIALRLDYDGVIERARIEMEANDA